MTKNLGFLKRSQKFREDASKEIYFPILDSLYPIAIKHHNNLPTLFSLSLEDLYDFSPKEVAYTLSILYPERRYSCKTVGDSSIYCVNS